jgi:hypothetical protein
MSWIQTGSELQVLVAFTHNRNELSASSSSCFTYREKASSNHGYEAKLTSSLFGHIGALSNTAQIEK